MARVFPEWAEIEQTPALLSAGERQVLDWLSALDDEWLVYVQPRLGLEQPDFVAVHPTLGICAIEIRDWVVGGVAMSPAGVMEIRDQGDWAATTDAPRVDAHRHRAAISDHLRRMTDDAPAFCEVAAVVVLTRHSTAQARDLLCLGTRHEFEQWIEVWGFDDLQYDPAYVLTGSRHPVPRPVSPACIDALHHLVCGPAAAVVRPLPRLAARAARLALEVESVVVIVDDAASPVRLRDATLARCSEIGASANRVTFADRHELCQRAVDDARLWGHELGSPEGRSLSPDDDVHLGIEAYCLGHGLRFDAVLVTACPDENGARFKALYPHVLRPGGELLVMRDDSDDARRRIVEPSYEMSF